MDIVAVGRNFLILPYIPVAVGLIAVGYCCHRMQFYDVAVHFVAIK